MFFLLIEFCLTAIAVAVAFVFPNLGASWFESVERLFARLARRRGLSVLVVGLAALVVRVALLPIEPVPEPAIHDVLPAFPRGSSATSQVSFSFERALTKFHGPVIHIAARHE